MPNDHLKKAQRFAVSGVLVTGFHVLVAAGFIRYILPIPSLANGVAFIAATVFSYLINTLWSFSSPLHGRNLIRFLLVSGVGFVLAIAVSGLAEIYGMNYWFGIVCVVAVVPPVTFVLHNFWTYR